MTITLFWSAGVAQDQSSSGVVHFLTGPNDGDALDIALGYIRQNRSQLGLTEDDLADWVVTDRSLTRHNQMTSIHLRQRLNGIEVFNGSININVAVDGSIINLGNHFVSNLRRLSNTGTPALSPVEAVESSARHLNLSLATPLRIVRSIGGRAREVLLSGGGISEDQIPVKLVYQPVGRSVRLAWSVVLRLPSHLNWWHLRVDAVSGEVLSKNNWTVNETSGVSAKDRGASRGPAVRGFSALQSSLGASAQYRVFPLPFEHPLDTGASHALVSDPSDPVASPFGWHDTDAVAGAEFTDTRGNNVFAQEDADANNRGGFRPDGGAGLLFDFAWDSALQPADGTNQEAAITNLFYWNNILHDVFYQYGFDEASGNFQENDYGRGGIGGDPVQADAQDGSGFNNANFSTPPDGFDPRMQMFIWLPAADHLVTVHSPASIAGDYVAGGATFGPSLDETGLTSDVVLADDGTGTSSDACEPLINGGAINGNIALIDRGDCNFTVKVKNAQNVGAIAAIVANNQGDDVLTMGGTDPTITIPSVFIGQSDGATIKGALGVGVNATVKKGGATVINRDSDLDNGIIAHEYTHGISNRLTGGPSTVSCLFNDEQMGEGWSDFVALALTAKPSDTGSDARPVGTYVTFQPLDGSGIRLFPYSTDLAVNPQTYADIASVSIPHGVGSVWTAMVWEMYWNLVDEYGFDPDLYNGLGGNNLAIQLVTDGMKLQSCSPSFVDGRNAILLADLTNNLGANRCLIWKAFAKRGLGVSADAGSSSSVSDGTEAFDIPALCANPSMMRSAGIALREVAGGGLVGLVLVLDENDARVPVAQVSATWTFPDGSSLKQRGPTGAAGLGLFRTDSVGPGLYTLTVEGVTKAGFEFDAAGSVLSKTIEIAP